MSLVPIKKCASCRKSATVYHSETQCYSDYCSECSCVELNCTARASHDNGFCDVHFVNRENLCQLCLDPCNGLYCYKCYKMVPKCEAVGCKLCVILDKEKNEYFKYCQRCKCGTFTCCMQKSSKDKHCNNCESKTKCIDCGRQKSLTHDDPRCSKCQAKRQKCLKCHGKTGYFYDDGHFVAYKYCSKCVCKTTGCFQVAIDTHCEECIAKKPKKCVCGIPIPSNCSFCTKCEMGYLFQKVKCPTQGCKNYMAEQHSKCSICKRNES